MIETDLAEFWSGLTTSHAAVTPSVSSVAIAIAIETSGAPLR